MTRSLSSLQTQEGLAMIIVSDSARSLKGFIAKTSLGDLARAMVLKMALAFILHRGRMTCSQAAGSVASESIHRGQLTRFLARPRWQKDDFNAPLRSALLQMENGKGEFIFLIDATLVSQSGRKTQNLKDWTSLSLKTIRLRASTGKYAGYRRLSRWRVGPKQKPRVYYAHQERLKVRSVGYVQLVFSTMKPGLKKATPDDVKILMTNATGRSVSEIIELYSLRWQIELFFKELKSTLGLSQYSFRRFEAAKAWVEIAITTALFLEHTRAKRLADRRLSKETRQWWRAQRLHGLCAAFRQECEARELKYLSDRLKTSGGVAKLKRLLTAAVPAEYRAAA